jgi:hypothetical protein
MLLDACIKVKLTGIPDGERHVIVRSLGRLAASRPEGGVFFGMADVVGVMMEQTTAHAMDGATIALVDRVFETGLLVTVDEQCRFAHHSLQQYFTAVDMAHEARFLEYARNELMHEALVIMAGLLDRSRLLQLFDVLRHAPPLFAYVLGNVDEPDTERSFLLAMQKQFMSRVQRMAVYMYRQLAALAIAWLGGLPLWAAFAFMTSPPVRYILVIGAAAHLLFGLALVLRWHRSRFERTIAGLRHYDLPELIAVNRFNRGSGILQLSNKDLSALHEELVSERLISDDDPRVRFLADALEAIRAAIDTASVMTEEEMLQHLDDPLVVAAIDPTVISNRGVNELCRELAADGTDVIKIAALDLLRRIHIARAEFKDQIAEALVEIATALDQSPAWRRRVFAVCVRLRIPVPESREPRWSLRELISTLLQWVRGIR